MSDVAKEIIDTVIPEVDRLGLTREQRVAVNAILASLEYKIEEHLKIVGTTWQEFSAINASRGKRWHNDEGLLQWSVSDWLMAMAGEAGEACNAGKKLRRIELDIKNISADPARQLSDQEKALDKIAEELADTVIYCDLTATRIKRPLFEAIRKKFNATSTLYDFPERL